MNITDVRDDFQGTFTTYRQSTEHIVVHHAAALYPTGTGIEDVRAINRYHTRDRGWPGIGYHIVLAESVNGGPIERFDVSDLNLQRAHILNLNHRCVGICCATNFTGLPAQKWIDALVETLKDVKKRFPSAKITGHKEIAVVGGETTCPGPRWNDWKPGLLAAVAGTVALPVAQPWGTFPVHPALRTYHERSGGIWAPNRYCLDYAVSEMDPNTKIQRFERGALRLNPDGTVSALLRSEW